GLSRNPSPDPADGGGAVLEPPGRLRGPGPRGRSAEALPRSPRASSGLPSQHGGRRGVAGGAAPADVRSRLRPRKGPDRRRSRRSRRRATGPRAHDAARSRTGTLPLRDGGSLRRLAPAERILLSGLGGPGGRSTRAPGPREPFPPGGPRSGGKA